MTQPEEASADWYLFVIYKNPSDFPGQYVVRRWKANAEGAVPALVGQVCMSLEQARDAIPKGSVNLGRREEDDPVIAETWLAVCS